MQKEINTNANALNANISIQKEILDQPKLDVTNPVSLQGVMTLSIRDPTCIWLQSLPQLPAIFSNVSNVSEDVSSVSSVSKDDNSKNKLNGIGIAIHASGLDYLQIDFTYSKGVRRIQKITEISQFDMDKVIHAFIESNQYSTGRAGVKAMIDDLKSSTTNVSNPEHKSVTKSQKTGWFAIRNDPEFLSITACQNCYILVSAMRRGPRILTTWKQAEYLKQVHEFQDDVDYETVLNAFWI